MSNNVTNVTIHFLARNYAIYSPILRFFHWGLSHNFFIWLLKILSHLKYVTTVPCNLSLITTLVCNCHSFCDINVSQGSVATRMRCGGIFNKHFAANLLENVTMKIFLKIGWKLKEFIMSLVSHLFATRCIRHPVRMLAYIMFLFQDVNFFRKCHNTFHCPSGSNMRLLWYPPPKTGMYLVKARLHVTRSNRS